jgi:hypothetical protein
MEPQDTERRYLRGRAREGLTTPACDEEDQTMNDLGGYDIEDQLFSAVPAMVSAL